MPSRWPYIVFLSLASISLIFALSSCAKGMDGVRQSLTNASQVQTEIMGQILKFDSEHQKKLVDDAHGDLERAKASIATYRENRDAVVKLILEVGTLTKVASEMIPLIEAGTKPRAELDELLAILVQLSAKVVQASHDLRFKW